MRPATFSYVRARTVDEAVHAMGDAGDGGRVLAGGQVLVNLMRARHVRPSVVVDISGLAELDFVRAEPGHLVVGALTRMRDLAASPVVADTCPALAQAARAVGDPQVRNRASAGGNLCNPDPVSDLAPVLLASSGVVVLQGPGGRQEVPAADFFDTPLGSVRAGQVIVELRFGRPGMCSAFEKLSRRAADSAVANAAAVVRIDAGVLTDVGLGLGALHERPVRARAVEDALRDRPFDPDAALALLREFCTGLNPPDTVHADAAYRQEAGPVIATRALRRAVDEAMRR